MWGPRTLSLDELLDVCVRNQIIDSYLRDDREVTVVQEPYVHVLSLEHARLYLQNLVQYSRTTLEPIPASYAALASGVKDHLRR